jgi:hypothetical protein
MTPEEIYGTLTELFDSSAVHAIGEGTSETNEPGSWQIETLNFRMLVLLSDDQSWLRVLLPIMPASEAQPFVEQLLQANFDDTQEVRYALHQGVVWGVFQHSREGLVRSDFSDAIARLVSLYQLGLSDVFSQLVESRMHQIIQAAKQQGQSLEATLQNLDRFYEEGILGDLEQGAQSREQVLAAWRRQLERLWPEVQP